MVTSNPFLVRGGTGIPSFKGCHNSLKGKTYFFLHQERETGHWYSARELHLILGLPLHSLRTHLPRWYRWGRVLRRHRGVFQYRIAASGFDWVERWGIFMPLQRYVEEIEDWQAKNS